MGKKSGYRNFSRCLCELSPPGVLSGASFQLQKGQQNETDFMYVCFPCFNLGTLFIKWEGGGGSSVLHELQKLTQITMKIYEP